MSVIGSAFARAVDVWTSGSEDANGVHAVVVDASGRVGADAVNGGESSDISSSSIEGMLSMENIASHVLRMCLAVSSILWRTRKDSIQRELRIPHMHVGTAVCSFSSIELLAYNDARDTLLEKGRDILSKVVRDRGFTLGDLRCAVRESDTTNAWKASELGDLDAFSSHPAAMHTILELVGVLRRNCCMAMHSTQSGRMNIGNSVNSLFVDLVGERFKVNTKIAQNVIMALNELGSLQFAVGRIREATETLRHCCEFIDIGIQHSVFNVEGRLRVRMLALLREALIANAKLDEERVKTTLVLHEGVYTNGTKVGGANADVVSSAAKSFSASNGVVSVPAAMGDACPPSASKHDATQVPRGRVSDKIIDLIVSASFKVSLEQEAKESIIDKYGYADSGDVAVMKICAQSVQRRHLYSSQQGLRGAILELQTASREVYAASRRLLWTCCSIVGTKKQGEQLRNNIVQEEMAFRFCDPHPSFLKGFPGQEADDDLDDIILVEAQQQMVYDTDESDDAPFFESQDVDWSRSALMRCCYPLNPTAEEMRLLAAGHVGAADNGGSVAEDENGVEDGSAPMSVLSNRGDTSGDGADESVDVERLKQRLEDALENNPGLFSMIEEATVEPDAFSLWSHLFHDVDGYVKAAQDSEPDMTDAIAFPPFFVPIIEELSADTSFCLQSVLVSALAREYPLLQGGGIDRVWRMVRMGPHGIARYLEEAFRDVQRARGSFLKVVYMLHVRRWTEADLDDQSNCRLCRRGSRLHHDDYAFCSWCLAWQREGLRYFHTLHYGSEYDGSSAIAPHMAALLEKDDLSDRLAPWRVAEYKAFARTMMPDVARSARGLPEVPAGAGYGTLPVKIHPFELILTVLGKKANLLSVVSAQVKPWSALHEEEEDAVADTEAEADTDDGTPSETERERNSRLLDMLRDAYMSCGRDLRCFSYDDVDALCTVISMRHDPRLHAARSLRAALWMLSDLKKERNVMIDVVLAQRTVCTRMIDIRLSTRRMKIMESEDDTETLSDLGTPLLYRTQWYSGAHSLHASLHPDTSSSATCSAWPLSRVDVSW